MSRHIFTDFDRSYIIKEHFIAKRTANNIGSELGVGEKPINRVIKESGRVPLKINGWHYGAIALKCAIHLYRHGIGITGIARRLDISTMSIRGEFKRQGIKLRTQSQQETCKWRLMSDDERFNQTKSAHLAVKGVKKTLEAKEKRAKAIEFSKNIRRSHLEFMFNEFVVNNGHPTITQKAIGEYNIDICVVNSNIAVEIFGGNWHFGGEHARRSPHRIKKILDSGFSLIMVHVIARSDIVKLRANLITLINFLSAQKTPVGKYWMIWSTGNFISFGSVDSVDIALIHPFGYKMNGCHTRD